jgi:hypothetical protein
VICREKKSAKSPWATIFSHCSASHSPVPHISRS